MPTRAVITLLVATGCGTSVGVTPLNSSPRPLTARAPADVEVFVSQPPPYPYVDVAYLEAEQESEMSTDGTAEFLGKLRVRAAEIGCDALVLGGPTSRTEVSWADVTHDVVDALGKQPLEKPATYGQPVALRGMTATCIVYREPAGTASARYQGCRQQRIDIMKRAAQIKNPSERGRMFRTMPTCGEPPPA